MDEKKENLLFFIVIVILFSCFIIIPLQLSKNNIFLGGDSVGGAGAVEQIFIKVKKGEVNLINVFLFDGVILKEINYPNGCLSVANLSTGINVVLRFVFADEISAWTATVVLYEILNILSLFFILKRVLKINFFLSLFFSIITIFFPYYYYRLHHQNLVAFWQEIFLIYFIVRFIEKPIFKYFIYSVLFIFINIFFNIQTFYFFCLTFIPALIIAFFYKVRNDKKLHIKSLIIYSSLMIVCSILIFYFSPYGLYGSHRIISDNQTYKKYISPIRDKSEIKIWKAPINNLFLPTDVNILFGKFTGKKFKSKWGYHEKAIYLGISFLFFYVILIFKILKKKTLSHIKNEFVNYSFEKLFLILGFFIFLFSIFWAIAPALRLNDFLYFLNKSARVYSRAIALAIVFWVILFAFLLDYSLKKKILKNDFALIAVFIIFLDIFPANFKQLVLKLEKCPEEYVFLSNVAKENEIFLDYFGRYGGYAEYGFILYKKCHKLIDFDFNLVDNKWDEELYNLLKKYKISYILFFKDNIEKNMNEKKIKKFVNDFKLKILFENKRSLIVKI